MGSTSSRGQPANQIGFALVPNAFFREPVPSMVVDGEPLERLVARLAPTPDFPTGYTGLVSVLLPQSETLLSADEAARIRSTLLPPEGSVAIAPLLMCPDDLDLSCTVVFARVERAFNTVTWQQLGVDEGGPAEVLAVGSLAVIKWESKRDSGLTNTMNWWAGVGPYTFALDEYEACLASFERGESVRDPR
jgi:hypothetical protein